MASVVVACIFLDLGSTQSDSPAEWILMSFSFSSSSCLLTPSTSLSSASLCSFSRGNRISSGSFHACLLSQPGRGTKSARHFNSHAGPEKRASLMVPLLRCFGVALCSDWLGCEAAGGCCCCCCSAGYTRMLEFSSHMICWTWWDSQTKDEHKHWL